ncbi:hypothetical protein ScPMuIL_004710 [Solemya velum]
MTQGKILGRIGPYSISDSSIRHLRGAISDEIIDAYFYLLDEKSPSICHINCIVMTAIFNGSTERLGILQRICHSWKPFQTQTISFQCQTPFKSQTTTFQCQTTSFSVSHYSRVRQHHSRVRQHHSRIRQRLSSDRQRLSSARQDFPVSDIIPELDNAIPESDNTIPESDNAIPQSEESEIIIPESSTKKHIQPVTKKHRIYKGSPQKYSLRNITCNSPGTHEYIMTSRKTVCMGCPVTQPISKIYLLGGGGEVLAK